MSDPAESLDRLDQAEREYAAAADALAPHDPDEIEELADRLREIDRIFETYEDRATGSGDFGGYVAFRSTIESFVETLPEDLPHRDALEVMGERVDKRRLSERDFEAAREALAPARDRVEALERYRRAIDDVQEARTAVGRSIRELGAEIEKHERLLELGDLDLDAPVERIRDPIDAYNQAVADAFQSYLRSAPASEVLDLFGLTHEFPLVGMPAPPQELHDYVTRSVPELTVHDLLEYAEYSTSKLSHFVDDAQAFRAAVATEQTYLERLSPRAFQVAWPPPTADRLRWELRELRAVVGRFAGEGVIGRLRDVEAVVRDRERFDELQEVAAARDGMSPADRRRLATGEVKADRDAAIERRDRLREALDEAPDP